MLFYFLLFFISFYISRYHPSQIFRTSFNIAEKKICVKDFPFLTDSITIPILKSTLPTNWTSQVKHPCKTTTECWFFHFQVHSNIHVR